MSDAERERAEKVAIGALLIGVVFILAGLRQPLTLLAGILLATAGALLAAAGAMTRSERLTVTLALTAAMVLGVAAAALDFGESWHASQLLERGASLEIMQSELRIIAGWRRTAQVGALGSAATMAGIALRFMLRQRRKIEAPK